MSKDEISVSLDPKECELILKHGYPFEAVEKIAKEGVSKGRSVTLKTSSYWLELLIGDLSHSANRTTSDRVAEELDALCTRLEIECGDASSAGIQFFA